MEIKFNRQEVERIVESYMQKKYKVKKFKIKEWVDNIPEGIVVEEIPKPKNILTPVEQ